MILADCGVGIVLYKLTGGNQCWIGLLIHGS